MTEEGARTCKETVDDSDTSKRSVDYYYLEAMRYLSCSEHHSDESDSEHPCNCQRCRKDDDASTSEDKDRGSPHQSFVSFDEDTDSGLRERSWSHSMAEDYESGTISQLPNLEGKIVGGRLKTRRYSDGMLIKPHMKLNLHNNGHVQWADDCHKELIRCRPRKKYVRNPSVRPAPVKSILKHSSEESLPINEDSDSD